MVNTVMMGREEIIIMIEITDPVIEIGVGLEMVMEMVIGEMTDMIVDKIIQETILDRITVIKGIGIEV